MKRLYTLLPALFACLLSYNAQAQLQQDTFFITGPNFLCLTDCAEYAIPDFPAGTQVGVAWSVNGVVQSVSTNGTTFVFCPISPNGQIFTGTVVISAQSSSPNFPAVIFPITVFVSDQEFLEVQPVNPPICEGISDCQRVCVGDGIELEALSPGGNPGQQVFWTVTGTTDLVETGPSSAIITWQTPGFYFVEVFSDSGCAGSGGTCIEVIPRPEASFQTSPPGMAGTLEICAGQTVYFDNQSTAYNQQLWSFGDGATSTAISPQHTFSNPGSYEVVLGVLNACACADYDTLVVNVLPGFAPDIACTATVCAGDEATYSTTADCTDLVWSLVGDGTIIAGGGPSDTFCIVQWNSGPEGTISLLASNCSGGDCPSPTEIRIPILDTNAPISGPSLVCRDELVYYEIPPYEATDFNWQVSGGGFIVSGQGTHSIGVQWFDTSQPQWVSVEYDNCYLNCQGSGYLDVLVRNKFRVQGPARVCPNSSASYLASNLSPGVQGPWTFSLQDQAGNVLFDPGISGTSASIDFAVAAGSYWVVATPVTPTAYCLPDARVRVEVLPQPSAPDSLAGPLSICGGDTYTYQAFTGGNPDGRYRWTVTGGTASATEGNPVNIIWNASGPYEIQVERIGASAPFCASAPLLVSVQAAGALLPFTGFEHCLEEATLLQLTDNGAGPYTWSLSPANAGTLLSPQGGASMELVWHQTGPVSVQVAQCGSTSLSNGTVSAATAPVVAAPTGLCPSNTTTLSATGASSYAWYDENQVLLSSTSDVIVGPGLYELIVTDALGCTAKTNVSIPAFEPPSVYISTPNLTTFCPGDPFPVLFGPENVAGWNYQWLLNGMPLPGANSSVLTTAGTGSYQLEATTANGCSALSNSILVSDSCPGGGGGGPGLPGGGPPPATCVGGTDIQMQANATATCNVIDFQDISPAMAPGTQQWFFGDGNSSTQANPTHTYDEAGYYLTFLIGNTLSSGDICWDSMVVEVPVAARFDAEAACPGAALNFFDASSFMPGFSISSWSWDFGDPASGAANSSTLQNPSHVYSTPGNYTVTLTVESSSGCVSVYSSSVLVRLPPNANFVASSTRCEEEALSFTADTGGLGYVWDFDNPAAGPSNTSTARTAYHAFETAGQYNVVLSVEDIYGCTNSSSQLLDIVPNTLAGDITPLSPISLCQGDSMQLSAPAGGNAWSWSTGATTPDIMALEAGVYALTITDDNGCRYEPDPAIVNSIAEPLRELFAVELDAFGAPLAYYDSPYIVCEGEDVVLQLDASQPGQNYAWSTGQGGVEVAFTDERGNLLSAGTYNFSVTVTDVGSGCTAELGPFEVIVHPRPDVPVLSAPPAPLCAGTQHTLSVLNPDAALSYQWSTTEQGTSIQTFGAGQYVVQAQNAFGCRTPSDPVTVEAGPDIARIPTGCRVRCNPDTICLPPLPGIVDFQWFLNGLAIDPPAGTTPELIATESGVYTLQMTDAIGCSSLSEPLDLELFDGFGTLNGQVFVDVNEDGLLNAGDTTISGIVLLLLDASNNQVGAATSNAMGIYVFSNIPAGDYTVEVDLSSVPPGLSANLATQSFGFVGCDQMNSLDWLLSPDCPPSFGAESFVLCPGDSISYQGITLLPGTTQDFVLSTAIGCDSIVTVSVTAFSPENTQLSLQSCPGVPISYAGVDLLPGAVQDFTFTDSNGCDSVITVTVTALPTDQTSIQLGACTGQAANYNGSLLQPGTSTDFTFSNSAGCDSVVTVTVVELPEFSSNLSLQVCEGETVQYGQTILQAGDVQSFVFPAQNGCDSTVTVSVQMYPAVSFNVLTDTVCHNQQGSIEVVDLLGGDGNYLFSLNGGPYQSEPLLENLNPGAYSLSVQDGFGCTYRQDALIPSWPEPIWQLQIDPIPCDGRPGRVRPTLLQGDINTVQFVWPDARTGSEWTSEVPGSYELLAIDQCGEYREAFELGAEHEDRVSLLYVPNAFSPNFDGFNDEFRGFLAPNVQVRSFEFRVFDRWGNQVFESFDPEFGWNGVFRGKSMNPAVYVYYIRAELIACRQEVTFYKEGDVTLVR